MGNLVRNLAALGGWIVALSVLVPNAAAQSSSGDDYRGDRFGRSRSRSSSGEDRGFRRDGPAGGAPGYGFREGDGRGGPGFGPGGGPYPSRGPGFAPGFGPGFAPPFGRPPGMPQDGGGQMSRYEYFLQRMDRNNDGKIDPKELDGPAKPMFEGMAKRVGLDPSKPISVAKFRKAMMRRNEEHGEHDHGGENSDSAQGEKAVAAPTQEPLVPGFGVAVHLPPVPGFGVRVGGSSSSVSAANSEQKSDGSSSVSDKSRSEYKVRAYAKAIVQKYDRNRNGSLEQDEWGKLRADPKDVDRNNDGSITEEELAARFMKDGSHHGSLDPVSSGQFRSQKSYRFVSPTERLPDGLPEWFAEKDADHDGQVAMDEYASIWTDSTAREFTARDLNNDGVITPAECLAAGAPQLQTASVSKPETQAASISTSETHTASISTAEPATHQKRSEGGGSFWWQQ